MEWYLALLVIMGSLLVFMVAGIPVAFCFVLVNLMGAFLFWGGLVGIEQLMISLYSSLATFILLPLPMFILMGEVMFYSGVAPLLIDSLDKLLGRLPGRLSFLAVGAGTLFSTLTGTSMASVAMLGSVLVPEMEKRGYKKAMSLGPILGSGSLAHMIPPSALGVLLGAIALISIGRILIAIIIPGLLVATLFAIYIFIRCKLQPHLAPAYEVPPTSLSDKFMSFVRYVLPVGLIIFLVIGVIFMGIATPSEAAATGAIGSFILAAICGKLNWGVVKKSVASTASITVMILMIIAGASAFSQNLAFTGASRGLIELAVGFTVTPILIIVAMQVVVIILGAFMECASILMITLPLFIPIVLTLGYDPVWFAVLMLINLEMAVISPPVGLCLFTMKGVAPPDTTMGDIYKAALPFLGLDLIAMVVILIFPQIALWLPGIMH